MSLMDAAGFTIIINFFWPLIVGVIVLILVFRMASATASVDYESDAAEKAQVTFVRRAFWTGIIIVLLCIIVWYLPEIKDIFENFLDAASKAKNSIAG